MSPRDLYFASYHQAAHVVSALVFGCRIEYVEIGNTVDKIGWNLDSASVGDAEAVCCAGFEMEMILGRRQDLSWSRSGSDRALLETIHSERMGETLTSAELDALFTASAKSSRTVLEHAAVRHAIDELAEHLSEAYLRGDRRVEAADLTGIAALITGVAPRA